VSSTSTIVQYDDTTQNGKCHRSETPLPIVGAQAEWFRPHIAQPVKAADPSTYKAKYTSATSTLRQAPDQSGYYGRNGSWVEFNGASDSHNFSSH